MLCQLHHHDGGEAGGFCAQTACTEMDGGVACGHGLTHLIYGEIALRTNEYGGIEGIGRMVQFLRPVGSKRLLAERVEEVSTGNLLVTVSDILTSRSRLADERVK